MPRTGSPKNPNYDAIVHDLKTTGTPVAFLANKYGLHFTRIYSIAHQAKVDLKERKKLPRDPASHTARSGHQTFVSFAVTEKEATVLNEEAKKFGVTKSELIRGVLLGEYSIVDALDEDDCGLHDTTINLSAKPSFIAEVNEVARKYGLSRSQAIRDMLYERL